MSAATEILREHVKEQYDGEIQRKNSLLERAGIATAILLLEGNIIAALSTDFCLLALENWHLLFYVPLLISLLFGVISIGCLGFFFFRADYYEVDPGIWAGG